MTTSARTEHLLVRNLVEGQRARAAAEAGVHLAAASMMRLDPQQGWFADGRPYALELAGVTVEIRLHDEAGRIDINQAPGELLQRLFEAAGAGPEEADFMVRAIESRRSGTADPAGVAAQDVSPGRRFIAVEELLAVGVSAALYRCVVDDLTVHGILSTPMLDVAPPRVLAVAGMLTPEQVNDIVVRREAHAGTPQGIVPPSEIDLPTDVAADPMSQRQAFVFTVTATARLDNGHGHTVRARIRPGAGRTAGAPFAVLQWRDWTGVRGEPTGCEVVP